MSYRINEDNTFTVDLGLNGEKVTLRTYLDVLSDLEARYDLSLYIIEEVDSRLDDGTSERWYVSTGNR